MAPSGGQPVAKSEIGGYPKSESIPMRLSQKQKKLLQQIEESQPVSAIRLGFFGKKVKTLLLLEQKGLIDQGETSLLGRLWSLTVAGRSFLKGSYR
jgi:hypothetical protein